MAHVDVLIPTFERPAALAVTLTSLLGQTYRDTRVVVSDQSEHRVIEDPVLAAVARTYRALDRSLEVYRHLPRRGIAEHRQSLLDRATAPYALFLDDDVILAPWVIQMLVEVLERERCGFAGSPVIGPSYLDDERPDEQAVEFWDRRVCPEAVTPDSAAWERWRLHNAANPWHLQRRLGITHEAPRTYRVAWVGGCVLYDVAALREVGGFRFWRDLPPDHAGEDILAQLRVMKRFGGCGVLPSGAYHQELPTTIRDRTVDAPRVLPI